MTPNPQRNPIKVAQFIGNWASVIPHVVILYPPPTDHVVALTRIVILLLDLPRPKRLDLKRPILTW